MATANSDTISAAHTPPYIVREKKAIVIGGMMARRYSWDWRSIPLLGSHHDPLAERTSWLSNPWTAFCIVDDRAHFDLCRRDNDKAVKNRYLSSLNHTTLHIRNVDILDGILDRF